MTPGSSVRGSPSLWEVRADKVAQLWVEDGAMVQQTHAEHEGERAARVAALKGEAAEFGLTVVEPKLPDRHGPDFP
ncbi:hypothetical protein ACIHFD_34865 [Nonomuraea sp. NPDC051941]|uniref:hypothetical protein n=1 Tax=Nonomuraea sp. NPDC051941 TaxID=3364373 RepID=UPI0037CA3D67